jgi:aspartate kinase
LRKNGQPVHLLDAHTLLVTNGNYTSASIDWKYTNKTIQSRIPPLLDDGKVVITQGFIGADHKGIFTTLGREGSDFTAAIIANVMDGEEVSIWKDVPGLMNADPKRFKDTIKLDNISYHEAIELAFYGASVVHPKTIQPVQHKNIPLKVRSFYDPDTIPSVISRDNTTDDKIPKIIVKPNQLLLSIGTRNLAFIAEEHLTTIFDVFNKHKIHINLMQHSAVSFSVCFDEDADKLAGISKLLKKEFSLRHNSGLTLITIRHYNDEIIKKMIAGKEVFLEQKSRSNMQVLVS